jgi:hypothetical protein
MNIAVHPYIIQAEERAYADRLRQAQAALLSWLLFLTVPAASYRLARGSRCPAGIVAGTGAGTS